MCGEYMRLTERVHVDRIPGTNQVSSKAVMEWVCPECDYFEEHEPERTPSDGTSSSG